MLPPELQILAIELVALGIGYFWLYPGLGPLTNARATKLRLLRAALVVDGAAFLTVAALFWGAGTRFSLIVFETNWFIFFLITFVALDLPLSLWFMRRYGLTFDRDDP